MLVGSGQAATTAVEVDGLRVSAGDGGSLTIVVDGLPFGQKSDFWVVDPDWTKHYYGYPEDADQRNDVESTSTAQGGEFYIPMKMRSGDFSGEQRIEVLPGRKMRMSVDAHVTTDLTPLLMEHMVCEINPAWLAGQSIEWTTADGAKETTMIAGAPLQGELKDITLASKFTSLKLNTRMGRVDIETTGNMPLTLLDYRKNAPSYGKTVFWFGVLDEPLDVRHHIKYELTIQFPPAKEKPAEPQGVIKAGLGKTKKVLKADPLPDRIIPTPKKIEWKSDDWLVRGPMKVVVGPGGSKAEREMVERLKREVAEDAAVHGIETTEADVWPRVQLRLNKTIKTADLFRHPEQYQIMVSANTGVAIDAATTEGLMHGTKTLRQLYRHNDAGVYVRGCYISDYPSLQYRGMMMFNGADAGAVQSWLIHEIVGAFKFNHLMYYCTMVKWPSHPELHRRAEGMEMEDVTEVAKAAQREHLDVVPFLPAFGLKEWVRWDDTALPTAGDRRGFDPNDPKERAIVEDVIRDAVELFKPTKYVQIAHDELETTTGALLDSIAHWDERIRAMGLRAMIWGDLFLFRGEATDARNAESLEQAKQRRAGIPKQVTVTDWHYASEEPEAYTSLRLFMDEGLEVIACPWDDPKNIVNITRQVMNEQKAESASGVGKIIGVQDTTWAGFNFGQRAIEENAKQVAAWITSAEAAWTGGAAPHTALPFDPMKEFQRIWNAGAMPASGAQGRVAVLDDVANFDLEPENEGDSWLGLQSGDNMAGVPVGEQWFGRLLMRVPQGVKKQARGVLLTGRLNPKGDWPKTLEIDVETTASALNFVTAATFAAPADPPIAKTVVTYGDGSSESWPWRLGQTVFAFDDPRQAGPTPLLWEKKPEGKMPRYLHGYVWKNPHPNKVIDKVEFTSENGMSSLVVLGMSVTQARP